MIYSFKEFEIDCRKDGWFNAIDFAKMSESKRLLFYRRQPSSQMLLNKYPFIPESNTKVWAHPEVALDLACWVGDPELIKLVSKWTGIPLEIDTEKTELKVSVKWSDRRKFFYVSSTRLAKELHIEHKQILLNIEMILEKVIGSRKVIGDLSDCKKIALDSGFVKVKYKKNGKEGTQYMLMEKSALLIISLAAPTYFELSQAYLDAFGKATQKTIDEKLN